MIIIVDYDMGNVGSIQNMLKRIGSTTEISSDPQKILAATHVILPGVGSFGRGMQNLYSSGIIKTLETYIFDLKKPFLGICLGMQLMTKHSEEGRVEGLGWIDGNTLKFKFPEDSKLKIPHVGWNTVEQVTKNNLFSGGLAESKFYFTHSYYVDCVAAQQTTITDYGMKFVSSIQLNNLYGVQFHPEKSHRHGMMLLDNFTKVV